MCRCGAPAPAAPPEPTAVAVDFDPAPASRARGPYVPWARDRPATSDPEAELEDLAARLEAAVDDPEAAAELRATFDREDARDDFSLFCRLAWPHSGDSARLEWNWHHQLICDVLQALYELWKRGQREPDFVMPVLNTVFNLPPGSLKSRLISVFFMVWVWLETPGAKFICLSVNEDATFRDARMTRDLIRSPWYQSFGCEWSLKGDQDAVGDFANSAGGGRLSKPSGSEIVGLRGDFLMIDDPNNPKEAENKKTRDEVNDTWNTNIYNRVNDLSRSMRIGVQQRTHGMDWTGYVIARQGVWSVDNPMGWLHVVLPAEYEPERRFDMPACLREALVGRCPFDRCIGDRRSVVGESIHPSRFTPAVIAAERKRGEGTNYYAGQMQQRPAMANGGAVERAWLNFCRLDRGVRPEFDELGGGRPRPLGCHSEPSLLIPAGTFRPGHWDLEWLELHVDPANQKTEKGSNWGLVMMGGYKGRRLVLDDRSRRGDVLEIVATIVEMIKVWRPDRIVMERKAAWEALKKMLVAEMVSGAAQMITVDAIDPGPQGKEDRLTSAKPTIANGLLYILDGAEWAGEFVEELCTFPAAPQEDRVDCVTQCINLHLAEGDSDEWPDL